MKASPPRTPAGFPDCFHLKSWLSRSASALLVLSLAALSLGPRPAQARNHKYKVLYSFTGPTGDGEGAGFLLREADGSMYGTTSYGGTAYRGTVFKLSTKGKESILYNFNAGYGNGPNSLVPYHGKFYGATSSGGAYGGGTIFRLDKKGNEVVLYNFPRYVGPSGPRLDLVDEKGIFYGTTDWGGLYGYGSVFKMNSSGKVTTLYSLAGGGDPQNPCCLARDPEGNLYGFTTYPPNGTVFKLDTAGTLTTLYAFTGGADGGEPSANLILDASGNLYGGTYSGGDLSCQAPYGCGTIFMLDPSGNETVLYSFTGGPDGEGPSSLIRDTAGTFYGTTWAGGDANCFKYAFTQSCGVVFKLNAGGKESVLHAFHVLPDGEFPDSLIMDSAGELYGTTFSGGDSGCTINSYWDGCGTIFELSP